MKAAMRLHDWMYLLAASGHLTLAVLSLVRGRQSVLARPLALLCLAMFGWCSTSLDASIALWSSSKYLDAFFTALCPPLAFDLVITFVGARRARARIVTVAKVLFGGLALSSIVGFGSAWGWSWVTSSAWASVFLVGWVPLLAVMLVQLVRHLLISNDLREKARTRMMLVALVVGGAFATCDVLTAFGLSIPHLAPLGTLVASALVGTAVFRFRLFDRDLSVSAAVYAGALAVAAVVACFASARLFGGSVAASLLATLGLTLVVGAAVFELTSSVAAQRAHVERLASLGRFSSQMAHDLKNPLATLKGALQFLNEERSRGYSLDDHHDFLRLMLEQVDRLGRVVGDYERIGRVEPIRSRVDVNEIVRGVVGLEPFAAQSSISVVAELETGLPACDLDADLVRGALENAIRNAFEAMPLGGEVVVRTAIDGGSEPTTVVISVEDEGDGMDARLAERAFDDFYTTKPTGTGLGLAFVRRVAHAHGGVVSLRSGRGKGTTFQMRLPIAARS